MHGDYKKLWIGGYSQGGFMALRVGLKMEHDVGGLIQISSGIEPLITLDKIHESKKNIPIIWSHSTDD